MNLRVMTRADVPSGMRLKELAGWNQTASDWERFLDASPDGCFVAEADGGVVGTVTTIVYGGCVAWIGMVLVDPDFRGQGIGRRLLERAIEHLDELRVPALKLDATPQGRPIYAKLGFGDEYEIERWMLRREPATPGSRGSGDRTRSPGGRSPAVDEIADLDLEIFGADRSALLRSLQRDAPAFVQVRRQDDTVQGYSLGRRGSRADQLGPWVARDESSARELLEKFLHRSTAATILIDCVKRNRFALEIVRSLGFEFSRPLTRMVRGPNRHPGQPELVAGILGPEFG